MPDVLHSVVAVQIGFTTVSVQSTTASSVTSVAFTAVGGAYRNETHFACYIGHSACPLCSLRARGVCSRRSNNSSEDVMLLSISH